MPRSADTTLAADAMQLAIIRRMSGGQRTLLAARMSTAARATTLAAIHARHPEYDDVTARWALFRLLVGDSLFQHAWPHAPLVAA